MVKRGSKRRATSFGDKRVRKPKKGCLFLIQLGLIGGKERKGKGSVHKPCFLCRFLHNTPRLRTDQNGETRERLGIHRIEKMRGAGGNGPDPVQRILVKLTEYLSGAGFGGKGRYTKASRGKRWQ